LGQHGYKFSRNWYWGVAKPIVSLSIVCVGFYALSLWRWTRGDL
jgi:hypothetical protein